MEDPMDSYRVKMLKIIVWIGCITVCSFACLFIWYCRFKYRQQLFIQTQILPMYGNSSAFRQTYLGLPERNVASVGSQVWTLSPPFSGPLPSLPPPDYSIPNSQIDQGGRKFEDPPPSYSSLFKPAHVFDNRVERSPTNNSLIFVKSASPLVNLH